MVKNCDHVTIVVRDVTAAKEFFNLLGFKEDKSVVISGEKFEKYMGVDGIEAQHVTMVLAGASPRMEVQLLKYDHPDPIEDPNITNLTKLGYNHVCFAVDDIEAEVEKLKAAGVEILNDVMDFNDRKLVYFVGPEGITLELAQW
ncbi:MAG: VOC family protein [Anaerolineales bacterium]|nr:VOC family protein [Anaerolineales bacterium]